MKRIIKKIKIKKEGKKKSFAGWGEMTKSGVCMYVCMGNNGNGVIIMGMGQRE